MNWYYAIDNQPAGPISDEEFTQAVNSGAVSGTTLVWNETMTGWLPYSAVSSKQTPATPPPTPAPVAGPAPTSGPCSECGHEFKFEDMISYEGKTICGSCKNTFFQRLQEGAANAGRTPNRELMTKARLSLTNAWWFAFGALLVLGLLNGIAGSLPYCIGYIVSTILGGAFMMGRITFLVNLARKGRDGVKFAMIFDGFSMFSQAMVQYLVFMLMLGMWASPAILFGIGAGFAFFFEKLALGAILTAIGVPLLVFPMVYGYAYSMTFFVLFDNKTMGPFVVLKKSIKMMSGRKMKLFLLQLRFMGWYLLTLSPAALAAIPLIMALIKNQNVAETNPGYFFGMLGLLVFVALICAFAMAFVNLYLTVTTAHFYDDVKDRALDMPS